MNEMLTETTYLGPARVLDVDGQRLLVAMGHAKAWATPAMAFQYAAVAGDTLLVIGKPEVYYAIGVIAGRGRTTLRAAGDLELVAPHGRIDLQARDGIEIRTSVLRTIADKWDGAFGAVRQRCTEFLCHVRGALRWRARRHETAVDEVHRIRAGRISHEAEGEVQIDGRKINLG